MAQFDAMSFILALSAIKQGRSATHSSIVSAENNTTVSGYQVPQLTSDQIVRIYNDIVAGKNVIIVDATDMMHFQGINADVISNELFISFRYFGNLVLEYSENGTITLVGADN